MKFLDENGRVGGKINIVDLIVVVLLILVIAVIGVRTGSGDKTANGVDVGNKTYVVLVEGVRSFTLDAFSEGDELFSKEDGTSIGTIKKIESSPTVEIHDDGTGQIAEYSVDDKYNVYLTVETNAETTDGRTFVNGVFEISRNSSAYLKTKYVSFMGRFMEIN